MSYIVSIHSFRGGTGKSSIVANVAAQMALSGKKVAVIDMNLHSPSLAFTFGLDEKKVMRTLNDYLWGRYPISTVVTEIEWTPAFESYGGRAGEGGRIFFISASLEPQEMARMLHEGYDVNHLHDGIHSLIEELGLDFLFMDTHSGLGEDTLISLAISDILIITLRPNKQDFYGTAVEVGVARKMDMDRIYLVVNQCPTIYDFARVKNDLEETYKERVITVLPLSEEVAIEGQENLFVLEHPSHPFSQGVREISESLVRDTLPTRAG